MGTPRGFAAPWTFWEENAQDEAEAAQSGVAYAACVRAVEVNGLSDLTKTELAARGWAVSEYVPFGSRRTAYDARRLKYLRELSALGRAAAP